MNDITLAAQVLMKIFSGMFFTTESMFVLAVFGIAGIAFWVNAKLES